MLFHSIKRTSPSVTAFHRDRNNVSIVYYPNQLTRRPVCHLRSYERLNFFVYAISHPDCRLTHIIVPVPDEIRYVCLAEGVFNWEWRIYQSIEIPILKQKILQKAFLVIATYYGPTFGLWRPKYKIFKHPQAHCPNASNKNFLWIFLVDWHQCVHFQLLSDFLWAVLIDKTAVG